MVATSVDPRLLTPMLARQDGPRWGFVELFILLQTALPAALLLPGVQEIRPFVRAAVYLSGLIGLLSPQLRRMTRGQQHPSLGWLVLIAVYLTGVLLMSLDRLKPAAAQYLLITAVMAPAIWGANSIHDPRQLHRLLWLILLTSGLNSLVGVLQVYDPNRWMPAEFSRQISTMSAYQYRGVDGRIILRPCGLYDTPGAVGAPGAWASVIGLALAQHERSYLRRGVALACAFLGTAVIYLSLVRTALIIVVAGAATYTVLLTMRNRSGQAANFVLIVGTTLIGALTFAELFGGQTITDRFASLVKAPPTQLYYQNRGVQLESVISNEAFEYPLGVGLGSWGQAAASFGGTRYFCELQMHGWILDGGIPLLLLYSFAVVIAVGHDLRVSLTVRTDDQFMPAACIASINLTTAMTILSFVPFNTAIGIQFWLLTSVLWASRRKPDGQRLPSTAPHVETVPLERQ
jgi:hypothetical protein